MDKDDNEEEVSIMIDTDDILGTSIIFADFNASYQDCIKNVKNVLEFFNLPDDIIADAMLPRFFPNIARLQNAKTIDDIKKIEDMVKRMDNLLTETMNFYSNYKLSLNQSTAISIESAWKAVEKALSKMKSQEKNIELQGEYDELISKTQDIIKRILSELNKYNLKNTVNNNQINNNNNINQINNNINPIIEDNNIDNNIKKINEQQQTLKLNSITIDTDSKQIKQYINKNIEKHQLKRHFNPNDIQNKTNYSLLLLTPEEIKNYCKGITNRQQFINELNKILRQLIRITSNNYELTSESTSINQLILAMKDVLDNTLNKDRPSAKKFVNFAKIIKECLT